MKTSLDYYSHRAINPVTINDYYIRNFKAVNKLFDYFSSELKALKEYLENLVTV